MARAAADNDRALKARDVALLAVGCVVAAMLVPVLPFVGVPVAALTLAWLTYEGRYPLAIGLAVLAAVVVAVSWQDPIFGPAVGVMLLLCGPLTARALEHQKAGRVTVALAATLGVGWAALLIVAVVLSGQSLGQIYAEVTNWMAASIRAAGGTAPEMTAVAQAVRAFVEIIPAALVVNAALTAVLSVAAATLAATWAGRVTNRLPRLAAMDLSIHVAWPAIVGLLLLAASGFTHQSESWFGILGQNLLFIGRALLFVQGLAVFAGLYDKAKLGRIMRVSSFVLLAVTEMLLPLVSLTGLADLWLNIRRLPRDGAPATEES